MRLPLVLIAAFVLNACSGCRESPSPSTAAASLAPAAPVSVSPKPKPEDFENRYIVIVATEADARALSATEASLRGSQPELPLVQLSSTDYAGLRPCLALLVAGAFPEKARAMKLRETLSKQRIASYVRNTHAYVGRHPARVELCNRAPTAPADVWLLSGSHLLLGPTELRAQLETDDKKTWEATPSVKELNGVTVGQRVKLYSLEGQSGGECRVSSFRIRVRGVPHFSYFQQEPSPQTPGCGSEEGFAVLDGEGCSAEKAVLAVPIGAKEPQLYRPLAQDEEDARVAKLVKRLKAHPVFVEAQRKLSANSTEDRPLEVAIARSAWRGGRGTVVSLQADLDVELPEEERVCGIESEHARIIWTLLLTADGENELSPPELRNQEIVEGVIDLDGDGELELLRSNEGVGGGTWLERGGSILSEDSVAFCDCPC